MFAALGPVRQRFLIGGIGAGLGVAAAIVFVLVRADEAAPPPDAGPAPVVLVHGYGGDSSTMSMIAQRLQREGLQVTSVDLPDNGLGDIVDSAAFLADTIDDIGAEQVDLVGFSAGGLVARAYLEHLDGTERARYVITLGSPHHGTTLGGAPVIADPALCVDACAQMAPGSDFLEELNEPDETPSGPVFVTVRTSFDQTVTPPESAALEGAINVEVQSVCPASRAGHGDLPWDPMVLGLIVRTLRGDLTGAPAQRDCDRLIALGR